jgi:VanZ family protein
MIQNWFRVFSQSYFAIIWSLIIFGLCSIAKPEVPDLGWDKLHHFGAFGILGALWYWANPKPTLIIALGIAYGFLIEVWQHILPIGRTFDAFDGIADATGIIVAIPIAKWVKDKIMLMR